MTPTLLTLTQTLMMQRAVWIIMVGHWLFADQYGSIADRNRSTRTSCLNEAAAYVHVHWVSISNGCGCLKLVFVYVHAWLLSNLRVLVLNQSSKRGKYHYISSLANGKRKGVSNNLLAKIRQDHKSIIWAMWCASCRKSRRQIWEVKNFTVVWISGPANHKLSKS